LVADDELRGRGRERAESRAKSELVLEREQSQAGAKAEDQPPIRLLCAAGQPKVGAAPQAEKFGGRRRAERERERERAEPSRS
jgi:hypothetical protein